MALFQPPSPLDRIKDLVPVLPEKVRAFEERLRGVMTESAEDRRARSEAEQRMRSIILD